jgi:uncharacterized protein YbjT (DUF2867 family)
MDDVMPSHAVERDGRGMDIANRQLTGTGAIMGIGQALLEATTRYDSRVQLVIKESHMIVITAPTGLIGRQVLGNMLGSGEPIRVIVRDPSRLPSEVREGVAVVQGSHGDIDVVDLAFAGADAVFWLVPPDPHADSAEVAYVDFTRPACDAFKRYGVQRVVGISALGRGTAAAGHAGLVTASLAMDDLIASSGVSYRALTMPSFMAGAGDQGPRRNRRADLRGPQAPDLRHPRHRRRRRPAAAG